MSAKHFADRLTAVIQLKHSRVCVGLDPDEALLPAGVESADFCLAIVKAVAEYAVCLKPNAAFFEGRPNWVSELQRLCAIAREHDLPVILDAKRGDIGNTALRYAQAYLSADTIFEALTVNPYLGSDGVMPFVKQATEVGKGLFVLVKTSNPSSGELQDLELSSGQRVYQQMADLVSGWGREHIGESGYSCVGAVVGATYPEQLVELRKRMPTVPFLVPGYGAQGGGAQDVVGAFDDKGLGAIVNSSRGIIYAYRQSEYQGMEFTEAAGAAALKMRDEINQALAERQGGL